MPAPAARVGDALRRECGLGPFEISFVLRRQRDIADVTGAWIPYGTLAAACGLITAHHLRRALLRQLRMLPWRARPRALRAMVLAGRDGLDAAAPGARGARALARARSIAAAAARQWEAA